MCELFFRFQKRRKIRVWPNATRGQDGEKPIPVARGRARGPAPVRGLLVLAVAGAKLVFRAGVSDSAYRYVGSR